MIINFNIHIALQQHPKAQLIFHIRDVNTAPLNGDPDFCVDNLIRWRLDISRYDTFTSYQQHMKPKHYRRFNETQQTFTRYGAKISLIEGDWSQYAETVYKLYTKVAEKHGAQLYDLNYFRIIAQQNKYILMCTWYKESLIAVLVLVDEEPFFHSICCGLDYDHSKTSQAYSQMHYEFIRLAIDSKKFTQADVGITADDAKSYLDFEPIPVCMDVTAPNIFIRGFLRFVSLFLSATINSKAKLEISFRKRKRT